MNKIKSLTQILVSGYLIRLLITGASIGDAIVIIALSALYGFYMHLEASKEPVANQDLKDKIASLETLVNSASTKVAALQLRR